MLPLLLAQHAQRVFVQRHGNHLAGFGLVGMNPRQRPLSIDLRPFQQSHVRFTQPRRQRKPRHLSQVRRQFFQ
nr:MULTISPECIES: hypothetical protein [pseudomallei group]